MPGYKRIDFRNDIRHLRRRLLNKPMTARTVVGRSPYWMHHESAHVSLHNAGWGTLATSPAAVGNTFSDSNSGLFREALSSVPLAPGLVAGSVAARAPLLLVVRKNKRREAGDMRGSRTVALSPRRWPGRLPLSAWSVIRCNPAPVRLLLTGPEHRRMRRTLAGLGAKTSCRCAKLPGDWALCRRRAERQGPNSHNRNLPALGPRRLAQSEGRTGSAARRFCLGWSEASPR
jgi:hypothetical protein